MEESNKQKKTLIIIIPIVAIIIILGIILLLYINNLKPVEKEGKLIDIEIEEGMGISSISKLLEEKKVIKNSTVMKIYAKINRVNSLQAGIYKFNNSEDLPTIVEQLSTGDVESSGIKITFIEGKNIRSIAKTIAQKTNNTEEDVFELLEDESYIDSLIEKYWFLTEEIKDERIYYPLEGYLLPDTYLIENKNVSVETIFEVMLKHMDKFLLESKDKIPNDLTVHQMLTMASMAELEGKTYEDRQEIIGVFFNRVYKKMNLGSDVTTYYAFKVDMGDRDLKVKELNTENPYNTRGPNMAGKIPVGPICNPSKSAIEATINYKDTNALYFVADKNGKVYFTRNNDEHIKMINTLKKQGLWYVYK